MQNVRQWMIRLICVEVSNISHKFGRELYMIGGGILLECLDNWDSQLLRNPKVGGDAPVNLYSLSPPLSYHSSCLFLPNMHISIATVLAYDIKKALMNVLWIIDINQYSSYCTARSPVKDYLYTYDHWHFTKFCDTIPLDFQHFSHLSSP